MVEEEYERTGNDDNNYRTSEEGEGEPFGEMPYMSPDFPNLPHKEHIVVETSKMAED
jgi:hypothetical protein